MARLKGKSGAHITVRARKAEPFDASSILALSQPWTKSLFGRVNVVNMIEKAVLAVSLVRNIKTDGDDQEIQELVAHAAFFNYPRVFRVTQSDWESWISSFFANSQYTPLNLLFMTYFVALSDYTESSLQEIIRIVFSSQPDLNFIILVVPNHIVPPSSIKIIFRAVDIPGSSSHNLRYAFYECIRENHVPLLHIRKARTEDHDDLSPIFGNQTDNLKEIYGDYFLAELIEAQDENMQCLVAEVDDRAVGFMSISKDINFKLLNECFELMPYNGLCVPHPRDVTEEGKEVCVDPGPFPMVPRLCSTLTSDSSQLLDISTSGISDKSESGVSFSTSFFMNDPKKSSSAIKPFVPKFFGASNAFSIQLFCIDEKYEMRSCDFLPKAFAVFPDLDFIVITLQHHVQLFPLIQNFVRVTPRWPSTLPQELYIFHCSGLLKNFAVRQAKIKDHETIEKLVKGIELSENLLQDLNQYYRACRDADGTRNQAFVAECQKQIVGVAFTRDEQDIEYIQSHYNIEDYIYFDHHRRDSHGHLHHLILNPVFNHFMRYFLREILRLSHKTCLYYTVYPGYSKKETLAHHSLVCSLGVMVPVHARRQIKYPVKKLGINAPTESVLADKLPYALMHFNCKLSQQSKININHRIVVVGASDVALSFLETFVFCPHLCFNNLTLISPLGLPGKIPTDSCLEQMIPDRHSYSQEDHVKMSLRVWVNAVYGRLTAIDRRRKIIVVNNHFKVPYDYLVLSTGLQFQPPNPTGVDVDGGETSYDIPHKHIHRLFSQPPENLYLINNVQDAAYVLEKARNAMLHCPKPIIVYGININAYCCIQSLLAVGIAGNNILAIQPSSLSNTTFEDPHVEESMRAALEEAGVQVYLGYTLARWNDQLKVPEKITCGTFSSDSKPLRSECQAFFSFLKKAVDYDVFKAVNDACLVFDGKLVVDKMFCTTDEFIRGAGSLTKLYRHYHAEHWDPATLDSKEVGIDLATRMLCLFDPTLAPLSKPTAEDSVNLAPIYRYPHVVSALLPGGYHYLEVSKPGVSEPCEQLLSLQGMPCRQLTTGKANSEQGYMRLDINQYHAVDRIVCLSRENFPISNLIRLYGVHQRTLNNLVSRYDEGLIKDFYSYFRESWCMAIFHDRFPDLQEEIRELLIGSKPGDQESIEKKVRDGMEDSMLSDSQRQLLWALFKSTKHPRRTMETRMLSYLVYNYYHLPMFARPNML